MLASLLSGFSESRDWVQAVWEALPRRRRRGTRSTDTWGQVRALIEHWDEVDLTRAAINLAANEVEDRIIGRAHRRIESTSYGRDISRKLEQLDSYVQSAHGRDEMLERARRQLEEW